MTEPVLQISTPRWAVPLLTPNRYLGASGGRSGGKSHFFAERLVEEHLVDADTQSVCVREIQRSIKFSAKKLIEAKIKELGCPHLFDVQRDVIYRRGGDGMILFQGMQDHTADSVKSLEGMDRAWIEEAQSLSGRSIELLDPTIRKPGSQVWASWNPDQPDDAIEQLFANNPYATRVHVNYTDNPWCPEESYRLAEWQRKRDFERYNHIWLGGYNVKSEAQIFSGRWRVDEFEPGEDWDGPYQGGDFGFSQDPTCAVRCWIHDGRLFIEYDAGRIGLDLDDAPEYFSREMPGFERFATRWDSARPESISHFRRHGLPRSEPVIKWSGSVEDGIEWLKTFEEIIIHTRCKDMAQEARLYSYKVNKAGDVTDAIVDNHNHRWDSVRYALQPLIKREEFVFA